mmetsp:Transcript_32812/g.98785  ORF Transcript_32812/g.98785 Transcript_32812/m.98785 type:complete len:390 (+) Transcript_32812:341-1510(+)
MRRRLRPDLVLSLDRACRVRVRDGGCRHLCELPAGDGARVALGSLVLSARRLARHDLDRRPRRLRRRPRRLRERRGRRGVDRVASRPGRRLRARRRAGDGPRPDALFGHRARRGAPGERLGRRVHDRTDRRRYLVPAPRLRDLQPRARGRAHAACGDHARLSSRRGARRARRLDTPGRVRRQLLRRPPLKADRRLGPGRHMRRERGAPVLRHGSRAASEKDAGPRAGRRRSRLLLSDDHLRNACPLHGRGRLALRRQTAHGFGLPHLLRGDDCAGATASPGRRRSARRVRGRGLGRVGRPGIRPHAALRAPTRKASLGREYAGRRRRPLGAPASGQRHGPGSRTNRRRRAHRTRIRVARARGLVLYGVGDILGLFRATTGAVRGLFRAV